MFEELQFFEHPSGLAPELYYSRNPSRSHSWRKSLEQKQLRREEQTAKSFATWWKSRKRCKRCNKPINSERRTIPGNYKQYCSRACVEWWRGLYVHPSQESCKATRSDGASCSQQAVRSGYCGSHAKQRSLYENSLNDER